MLKRTVKTPKLYFYDTGLVCCLTKWSSAKTAMNGALLENYTVSEIKKSYQNVGREPYLYYYRDKDAKEIDLIMEGDGQLHPIGIKKTISNFSVIEKSPLQRGTGAVLRLSEKMSGVYTTINSRKNVWHFTHAERCMFLQMRIIQPGNISG